MFNLRMFFLGCGIAAGLASSSTAAVHLRPTRDSQQKQSKKPRNTSGTTEGKTEAKWAEHHPHLSLLDLVAKTPDLERLPEYLGGPTLSLLAAEKVRGRNRHLDAHAKHSEELQKYGFGSSDGRDAAEDEDAACSEAEPTTGGKGKGKKRAAPKDAPAISPLPLDHAEFLHPDQGSPTGKRLREVQQRLHNLEIGTGEDCPSRILWGDAALLAQLDKATREQFAHVSVGPSASGMSRTKQTSAPGPASEVFSPAWVVHRLKQFDSFTPEAERWAIWLWLMRRKAKAVLAAEMRERQIRATQERLRTSPFDSSPHGSPRTSPGASPARFTTRHDPSDLLYVPSVPVQTPAAVVDSLDRWPWLDWVRELFGRPEHSEARFWLMLGEIVADDSLHTGQFVSMFRHPEQTIPAPWVSTSALDSSSSSGGSASEDSGSASDSLSRGASPIFPPPPTALTVQGEGEQSDEGSNNEQNDEGSASDDGGDGSSGEIGAHNYGNWSRPQGINPNWRHQRGRAICNTVATTNRRRRVDTWITVISQHRPELLYERPRRCYRRKPGPKMLGKQEPIQARPGWPVRRTDTASSPSTSSGGRPSLGGEVLAAVADARVQAAAGKAAAAPTSSADEKAACFADEPPSHLVRALLCRGRRNQATWGISAAQLPVTTAGATATTPAHALPFWHGEGAAAEGSVYTNAFVPPAPVHLLAEVPVPITIPSMISGGRMTHRSPDTVLLQAFDRDYAPCDCPECGGASPAHLQALGLAPLGSYGPSMSCFARNRGPAPVQPIGEIGSSSGITAAPTSRSDSCLAASRGADSSGPPTRPFRGELTPDQHKRRARLLAQALLTQDNTAYASIGWTRNRRSDAGYPRGSPMNPLHHTALLHNLYAVSNPTPVWGVGALPGAVSPRPSTTPEQEAEVLEQAPIRRNLRHTWIFEDRPTAETVLRRLPWCKYGSVGNGTSMRTTNAILHFLGPELEDDPELKAACERRLDMSTLGF